MAAVPLAEQKDQLTQLIGQMCAAAAEALRQATVALRDDRERLAAQVQANDAAIDELRAKVEQIAVSAMTIHSPVAGDLRDVVSAIRSANDIERMGDLACHVARAVHRHGGAHSIPSEAKSVFVEMGVLGTAMAEKAAEVASARNVVLALELPRDDDAMDELLRDVFELLFDPEWSHGVIAAVDVALLARFYERFADHAVAVATEVVYAVTGRTIEEVAADLAAGPGLPVADDPGQPSE